ncbi:MAG: hypothetical protein ACRD1F_09945, partial [Terriglobales bacterium]
AWFTARATAPPVVPLFTHLTYRQGTIVSARLLPGGQGFVGSASWNNSAHISVFSGRLGTRSVLSLSGPGGEVVAVSQQGDLAVLQHYSEVTGGILARMPLSGGAPRPVLDNIEAADWRTGALATSAAIARFNPVRDDTTLEYPVGHVLFTTPASVTGLRISPNGRSLAFIEHFTSNDDKGRIALLPVDGGKERDLTRDYESALGLAWAPSGKAIWFTASDGLENFLHAVSLSGHVRTLFRGATDLQLCDVDAAGRALMISTNRRYLAKLMTPGSSGPGRAGAPRAPGPTGRQAGGVAQPRQAPRQSFVADISVLDASVYTALSADGKQVAIGDEDAGPNYSTYLRATTPGADPVRLGEGEPLGISPDGKWVVSILPTGPRQLVLLPTGVGQQQQLTHGAIGFVPVRVAWLPDSQSFIVLGNKPGEAYRSFQVNLHGQVKPVTAPGVASWVLTPDGRSLLAQTHAKPAYALYPLHGGAASPVKGLLPGDFPLRFGTAGDLLVARSGVLDKGTAFQVYRVNLHNGSRSLITTVPVPDSAGVGGISPLYMSISADGKTVSFGYMRELSTLGLLTGLR